MPAFPHGLVVALICVSALLALPAAASAADYTVDTTADSAPAAGACSGAAGDCSLRQAISKANADTTNDTITVPAGDYKLTIPGANEDNNATGDLDVNKALGTLTISGAGARSTTIDATGLGDRVLEVVAGTADISGFTLTGGSPPYSGPVSGDGGAINNDGTLTLSDSTITGNTSPDDGGGVSSSGSTAVSTTLSGDTFTQNTAAYWGGALDLDNGSATITNTTMTNNTSPDGGGAVDTDTNMTVQFTNDTIADNHTGSTGSLGTGGGIWVAGSNLQFANTIVANNTGASTSTADCAGTPTDQGHNLDTSGTCFTPSSTNGDVTGNPRLGALQNNGGQTDTLALLDGSPAINAGSNSLCPPIDQRGVTRPQPAGGACDIGAYEATPPVVTTTKATNITRSSAKLNGTVNPENLTTTYHFEWGTSRSYGHTTPATAAGAGNADESVSKVISGLKPDTLYHYRIVATNAVGTSVGADHTFRTKKPSYSGAYAPGQTSHVQGGTAHVKVVCPRGTSGNCTGTLRLRYHGTTIGTAHVHIRSGRSSRLTVHLSSRGRQLLGRTGRLRVTAQVQSHDRYGTRRTRSHLITLVGAAGATAPAFTG